MTIIAAAEQRTSDWFAARAGKVTASRVKDVLAKLKSGKPAAERDRYLWEVAAERITGESARHFTNAAMNHGVEHEVTARIEYEWRAGIQVQEIGFCIHRELDHFGCSPDGLVGEYGLVEIKCPFGSHVHLQTLTSGEMPPEHMPQVQAQLCVMGKEWCDFVSFDPRMPEPINLFVVRVDRDEQYIENMLTEVRGFLAEVDDLVQRIKTQGNLNERGC